MDIMTGDNIIAVKIFADNMLQYENRYLKDPKVAFRSNPRNVITV